MNSRISRRHLLLALTATAIESNRLLSGEAGSRGNACGGVICDYMADELKLLQGRWRSVEFRQHMFFEWADASSCELIISDGSSFKSGGEPKVPCRLDIPNLEILPVGPLDIHLYLSNGRETWLPADTLPAWLGNDRTLRLGPLGSHLVFSYFLDGDMLTLVQGRRQPLHRAKERGDIVLRRTDRT